MSSNAGFGSFFKYHGWLSPGVRLFRSIGFRAKSIWISTMFLVPLVTMLWLLWSAANDQVVVARSERQGLVFVASAVELLHATIDQRHAATAGSAEIAGAQAKVKSAMDKLDVQQKELGVAFETKKGYDALLKAYQAVAQKPTAATPDETFEAQTSLVQAVIGLIGNIADGSQLSLDPDLDTYHLMNISVVLGPQYAELLTRLRTLGFVSVQGKTALPPKRAQQIFKALALIEYIDGGVENSYDKGIEAFPDISKTFDMKGVDAARKAFIEAMDKQVMGEAVKGDATALLALGGTAFDREVGIDKQLMARLDARLGERIDRLNSAFYRNAVIALFFVALAFYLMLAFFKVMMGGLSEVAGHLTQITQGNLTTAPKPWGSDEAAQLMTTMGEMQTSLRRIVGIVLESSGGVNIASEEIASASHDLSGRTEASASSLEQTASAMEQISATVKHTSETVASASAIVQENATAATRGGQVISQVVNTMEGIRTSSNQIGEIISVIDGIAFQTNILALNAAVEAARAGEQGRGFAVVASEVRALAGRSAAAAKEIKTLITASIQQVENGNQVVKEAGSTIADIVANASKIDAMMTEISTATREQSQGVNQVSAAVNELDQGTQQNAALVEETAAAASALADQAQRLATEVSFFKLS